jgi:hypothetical protein
MAEERKVFHDNVIPLPDRPGIVQHDYYQPVIIQVKSPISMLLLEGMEL